MRDGTTIRDRINPAIAAAAGVVTLSLAAGVAT